MDNYNVLENSEKKFVAIKVGFNWTAFFFPWLWALLNKLYLISVIVFSLFLIFSLYFNKSQELLIMHFIGILFIGYYIGSEGNRFKEKYYLKRGYEFRETITADSPEFAIKKYLKGINS